MWNNHRLVCYYVSEMKAKKTATSTPYVQAARGTAEDRGLCTTCVSRKARKGKLTCATCAASAGERIAALRESAEARGVCIECLSRPRVDRMRRGEPVRRCQVCLDRAVVRRQAWLARQK